jgi:hypothetical protein
MRRSSLPTRPKPSFLEQIAAKKEAKEAKEAKEMSDGDRESEEGEQYLRGMSFLPRKDLEEMAAKSKAKAAKGAGEAGDGDSKPKLSFLEVMAAKRLEAAAAAAAVPVPPAAAPVPAAAAAAPPAAPAAPPPFPPFGASAEAEHGKREAEQYRLGRGVALQAENTILCHYGVSNAGHGVSIMPKIAPNTNAAAQPGVTKCLCDGDVFVVTERRQGPGQTYLKLQTGGWVFTNHPTTGKEICAPAYMVQVEVPLGVLAGQIMGFQLSGQTHQIRIPPGAGPGQVITAPFVSSSPVPVVTSKAKELVNWLQIKVKGMLGHSWLIATCKYNPATHVFMCTDMKAMNTQGVLKHPAQGVHLELSNCWMVDVPDRQGKKQQRFNISNASGQKVEVAAHSGGRERLNSTKLKRVWIMAMETEWQCRRRMNAERWAKERNLEGLPYVGSALVFGIAAAAGVACIQEGTEGAGAGAAAAGFLGTILKFDAANPMVGGVIEACGAHITPLMSSIMRGDPARLLQLTHDGTTTNETKNEARSWVRLDLPDGRSLLLTHYSLRHGRESGRLLHWQLQGSSDGQQWEVLKNHFYDMSLPHEGFGVAHWPVSVTKAYRCFRILQTGANSLDNNYLCCAGINHFAELR